MMPSRGMGAMKPSKMSGKSSRPAVGKAMAKGGKVKKLAVGGPATPPAPPVSPAQATSPPPAPTSPTTPPAPPVSPAQATTPPKPPTSPAGRHQHQSQRRAPDPRMANLRANAANQITKLKQEQLRQQVWAPGSANSLNPTPAAPGMAKGGKVKKFAKGGKVRKFRDGGMTTMERRITEMDKPTRPAPPAAKKPMPKKPSGSPPIPDRLLRGESEDKAPGERGYKKFSSGGVVKNMPTADQMGTLGMAKGGKVKPNWIKGAIKKPGALRASLGAKPGKSIPAGKLNKAAKASGKLGQRARFAKMLKGFKK